MNPYATLATLMNARMSEITDKNIVVGFDGFVDEIIQVVDERNDQESVRTMAGIAEFAEWAGAAAGKNSLCEIIVRRQDAGGCAVNLSDGLCNLGATVDLFATLGKPQHPAFSEIASRCKSVHTLGDVHGRTLALEFPDGKLMLCAVSQLASIDRAMAESELSEGAYPEACAKAQVIALTNWSLYPHMTAIWETLGERVFTGLRQRPSFLVDLVDPRGRTRTDQLAMLNQLRRMEAWGPVTLSLNLNEANALHDLVSLPQSETNNLGTVAEYLRTTLGISEVVIHNAKASVVAGITGIQILTPPWCAAPVKLTGAGDRFNAGYALGLALNLSPVLRLALGNVTASAFVSQGFSADLEKILSLSSTSQKFH